MVQKPFSSKSRHRLCRLLAAAWLAGELEREREWERRARLYSSSDEDELEVESTPRRTRARLFLRRSEWSEWSRDRRLLLKLLARCGLSLSL
jgi:hypothetical protein